MQTSSAATTNVRKVTVSLPPEVFDWAKRMAARDGSSVSAIITAAMRDRQRLEAMRSVDEWLGEGRPELTERDLDEVRREWRS